MQNNKFIKCTKATIINIIVAFFITIIILGSVKIVLGQKIDETITLLNYVSINLDEKKEVKIEVDENKGLTTYPEYGSKYAQIKIEKINIDLPVYFGDTLEILKNGVGHSSGSYFPGEGGSIVYMGHNSKNVFRRFAELQKEDKIIVTTTYGEFKYKIYDMKLINEKELDKIPIQKNKEILMVYTCYPFNNIGYANQRYVVYAERI